MDWTLKTCAHCFHETLRPIGPYESSLDPPLIDAEEYLIWGCPCGFQCGRKPDMTATRDPRYTQPVGVKLNDPSSQAGQWDE